MTTHLHNLTYTTSPAKTSAHQRRLIRDTRNIGKPVLVADFLNGQRGKQQMEHGCDVGVGQACLSGPKSKAQ